MARRVSWTNNSSNHLGSYVYRAETLDPQNLPAPVATVDPVAQGATAEWIDSDELAGGYCYAVQDFDDQGMGAVSEDVCVQIGDDFSTAQIGDEIGGGIYAGIDTIGSTDYHIIAGKAESEGIDLAWKGSQTYTTGTGSRADGLENTLAMEAAGIYDHPAGAHCRAYRGGGHADWYLPARDELGLLYSNLAGHPELADNVSSGDYTWASTEHDQTNARMRIFSTGGDSTYPKSIAALRVRPIRRVAV